MIPDKPVNQLCPQQRSSHTSPPLDQQAGDPSLHQHRQRHGKIELSPGIGVNRYDLDAGLPSFRNGIRRRIARGDQPDRDLIGGLDKPAIQWQAASPIQDDPDRGLPLKTGQAASQRRIIQERRAASHEDRIMDGTKPMPGRARMIACDPLAFACSCRYLAIQRGCQFKRDHRPFLGHMHQEASIQRLGFCLHQANIDLNTSLAELIDSTAIHSGKWIHRRNHDPPNASMDQGHGARRRPAIMAAGLQCDVSRRTERKGASTVQGLDLGMMARRWLGPTAPNDLAVPGNDAADRRIGPGSTKTALG